MARFKKPPKPAPAPTPTSIDITGTNGYDVLNASTLTSVKSNKIFGLDGNDKLTGGGLTADTLDGGAGNDTIKDVAAGKSDTSNDILIGGDGNDELFSSGGADRLDGGAGNDRFTVSSQSTNAVIDGGAGFDVVNYSVTSNLDIDIDLSNHLAGGTFHFAEGNINVVNVEAFEIYTGSGNDRIVLTDSNDTVYASLGDDTISGLGGADRLVGGEGADVIDGGAGNDLIYGVQGHDRLTGGDGADTFVYGEETIISVNDVNADVITDFNAAEGDRIDLRNYFLSYLEAEGGPYIGYPLNIANAVDFIDTANGVEIHLVPSDTVAAVLEGVTAAELTHDIFVVF